MGSEMFSLRKISLLVIGLIGSTLSAPQTGSKCSPELISQAHGKFAAKLLMKLEGTHKGNLAMSPHSIFLSLSMANYGAEGNTAAQLTKQLFNLSEEQLEDCKHHFSSFLKRFDTKGKKTQMEFLNAVLVNKNLPLKKSYQDLMKNVFNSTVQRVDFSNAKEAAKSINSHTKIATNNRIREIIKPGEINEFTKMILINAANFRGKWAAKFNPNLTTEHPFHIDDVTSVNVSMMYQMGAYQFYEGVKDLDEASFIVLPFEGFDYELVILLPNKTNGLSKMLKKLSTMDIDHIIDQITFSSAVEFICPTFLIENMVQLIEPLKELGINDAFSSGADFSGISSEPMEISKFVQKVFINVTETGADAAIVNRADFSIKSIPKPDKFYATMKVDHPFVYFIRHRPTRVKLISGYVKSP